jgi:hypothetical protein
MPFNGYACLISFAHFLDEVFTSMPAAGSAALRKLARRQNHLNRSANGEVEKKSARRQHFCLRLLRWLHDRVASEI